MPDATTLARFAAPGPPVFDAVTRSLAQGRGAGLTSMLGVLSGGVRA